jgi:hypothetical protein
MRLAEEEPLLLCIREAPGSSFSSDTAILTEDFRSSLQPHYANDRIAPQIRPRPLPSTSVLIYYSLDHPFN